MPHKYAQIAFTETVRQFQQEQNSRSGYARMDEGEDYNFLLSQNEAAFIEQRDSFYMASIGETGWPYLQHRGGPKGFLKILDAKTLGFADYSGNRQYVSAGNFRGNDRISLFFMDYPNQRRLKLMGRIEQVDESDWDTLAKLEDDTYGAMIERGFIIRIEAFDWNCPQHITPRYTEADVEKALCALTAENDALKLELTSQSTTTQKSIPALGDGEVPLVITAIHQLTPNIRSFELRHKEGHALPPFKAGAHLQIPVMLSDGTEATRFYSISSDPANRYRYEIAVLKETDGNGGSASVHAIFQLGLPLNCNLPQNYFELASGNEEAILIAGGIGITPIKSMAHQLVKARNFQLHYAGKSNASMAYLEELQEDFSGHLHVYASDRNERLDINKLLETAPKDSVFYICGPARLITAVQNTAKAKEIAPDRIKYEVFEAKISEQSRPLTIELARSGDKIEVSADQSVLDALLENGIQLPHSCKKGQCKSCITHVVGGLPEHNDHCLTPFERKDQSLMCPCVSRSQGDFLKLDL